MLNFQDDLIYKIPSGEKSQTRCLEQGDHFWRDDEKTLSVMRRPPAVVRVDEMGRSRLVWEVGRTYQAGHGRGKPPAWIMKPENWKEAELPSCIFAAWTKDAETGLDLWTHAKQVIFTADNQAHPHAWLQNAGWWPLRLQLLTIRNQRLTDIDEADARAEGFADRETFLNYWDRLHPHRNVRVWALTFKAVLE